MKKLFLALAAITAMQMAGAQTKEGKIIYEQKIDMHRRIPEENVQLRAMVPQFRTTKFELQFGNNQSLFKGIEEEPDITQDNGDGGRVVMRFGGGAENEYYKDFTTKKAVEKRDLMEEVYLVEDSIRSIAWKLEEGETKTIVGYACKKASGKTARGSDVIAWYSEDIPVASGPEQFNGLPGMILNIDANKGEIVFSAISVDKKIDVAKIKAPAKGKKVTGEEFARKQKELFGNQKGPIRIVTNN